MNADRIEEVIKKIEKRATSYAHGATAGFFLVILVLAGLGCLFYFIGFPEPNDSNVQFGVEVVFNLTLKLSLVVFSFYFIKLQMSVVSYNLAISNDLFAKAEALSLYSVDGKISLSDLYKHLSVNNHRFEALKDFSGSEEFSNLMQIVNLVNSEPNKSSKKDGDKAAASS
jgi:hypothetical protein